MEHNSFVLGKPSKQRMLEAISRCISAVRPLATADEDGNIIDFKSDTIPLCLYCKFETEEDDNNNSHKIQFVQSKKTTEVNRLRKCKKCFCCFCGLKSNSVSGNKAIMDPFMARWLFNSGIPGDILVTCYKCMGNSSAVETQGSSSRLPMPRFHVDCAILKLQKSLESMSASGQAMSAFVAQTSTIDSDISSQPLSPSSSESPSLSLVNQPPPLLQCTYCKEVLLAHLLDQTTPTLPYQDISHCYMEVPSSVQGYVDTHRISVHGIRGLAYPNEITTPSDTGSQSMSSSSTTIIGEERAPSPSSPIPNLLQCIVASDPRQVPMSIFFAGTLAFATRAILTGEMEPNVDIQQQCNSMSSKGKRSNRANMYKSIRIEEEIIPRKTRRRLETLSTRKRPSKAALPQISHEFDQSCPLSGLVRISRTENNVPYIDFSRFIESLSVYGQRGNTIQELKRMDNVIASAFTSSFSSSSPNSQTQLHKAQESYYINAIASGGDGIYGRLFEPSLAPVIPHIFLKTHFYKDFLRRHLIGDNINNNNNRVVQEDGNNTNTSHEDSDEEKKLDIIVKRTLQRLTVGQRSDLAEKAFTEMQEKYPVHMMSDSVVLSHHRRRRSSAMFPINDMISAANNVSKCRKEKESDSNKKKKKRELSSCSQQSSWILTLSDLKRRLGRDVISIMEEWGKGSYFDKFENKQKYGRDIDRELLDDLDGEQGK